MWQNQIFQTIQKQVRTATRTHIFDLILYVGILCMYMMVNILLENFPILGTIKVGHTPEHKEQTETPTK